MEEDYKYFYTFDVDGNLTSKQEKGLVGNYENFDYSSENQLVRYTKYVENNLIIDARYVYDALGRRIEKRVINNEDSNLSTIRRFAYDGNEILFEYNGQNTITHTYTDSTLRTDDVLSVSTGTNSYFYTKDGLGSITEVLSSEGSLVQSYKYSSFGEILRIENGAGEDITSSPVIKPYFTYTGREYDEESNLYYYRARYYDSSIGRFLQVDPVPGILNVPLTVISSFVYGLNNPILNTDPSGKILPALAIAFVVGGSLNALLAKNNKSWYTNFLVGGAIAAGGVAFGAVGAAGGGALAAAFGGSFLLGATLGGAVAGGVYSYGTQKIMNPNGKLNWLSIGFGIFAGGIGGAMYGASIGQAAQNVDTFNKTTVGAFIDDTGPSLSPAVPPTPPTIKPEPPLPPVRVPQPM